MNNWMIVGELWVRVMKEMMEMMKEKEKGGKQDENEWIDEKRN